MLATFTPKRWEPITALRKAGPLTIDELSRRFGRRCKFALARQRGSHAIMQKRTGTTTITVPVPMHHEIRIGTLQSIIRQSGLPKTLFEQS